MRLALLAVSSVMDLTYTEVGHTRGALPAGYHHVDVRSRIGTGRDCYTGAVRTLLSWEMHRRAGLRVHAQTPTAEVGTTVVLRLGPARIPCRVVYTVAEENRAGFAYGTMPGHPEQGEECFLVEFDAADDAVYAHVRAFSRPGRWYTRVGGPAGRLVQRLFTARYISALRDGGHV